MVQKQPKNVGFSQQLEPEYWNWTDDEKAKYMTDSKTMMRYICARIYRGLMSANADDSELAFRFSGIEHNKDTRMLYDPKHQIDVIVPKANHIHGFIELTKKRDLNVIAGWIGIEPQYLEIPKGRYGRENMLAYLVHAKNPEKYRYDPEEVHTFDTWDYMDYYKEHYRSWEEFRATTSVKQSNTKLDWLVKQVQLGKLTMSDIMSNDVYKMIYANNMRVIKDAQQFLNEERAFNTIRLMDRGDFELSVIFITGAPGAGKSYFANSVCRKLEAEQNWRTYEASGKNPMDNYSGEEILFLDDLRSGAMGATDWLKMLDHLSKSAISARYANKGRAYRTIVMTAYEEPYSYFSYMKGSGGTDEALAQFIRRINSIVKVYRMDDGERVALLSEVVQGEKRPYDLIKKRFVETHQVQGFQTDHIKMTNFYGHPRFVVANDEAIDMVVGDIKQMNDPALDHSNTERKTVDEISKQGHLVNKTKYDSTHFVD